MKLPFSLPHLTLIVALAVVMAFVFMTPLCGQLFGCGCSFLWSGADAHCNVKREAPPHCPWCSHGTAGFALPLAGFIVGQSFAGVLTLWRFGKLAGALAVTAVSMLPIGLLTGWATTWLLGYPHFLPFRHV